MASDANKGDKAVEAEAEAFAQLVALSPGDPDGAFRDAAACGCAFTAAGFTDTITVSATGIAISGTAPL